MKKIYPHHEVMQAMKKNLLPGLVLQAIMVGLFVAYLMSEPVRYKLEIVARWKRDYGYLFSFLSMAVATGLIPEFVRIVLFQKGKFRRADFQKFIFGFFYWGGIGLFIDFFYRCQALWFGNDSSLRTVVLKACVDMFFVSAFITCPLSVVLYRWRDREFQFSAFTEVLHPEFVRCNIIPVVVTCWVIFIPLALITYSLPSSLQLPFCVTAEVFWVLLLVTITGMQAERDDVRKCDIQAF